jgi:hypothetical protein
LAGRRSRDEMLGLRQAPKLSSGKMSRMIDKGLKFRELGHQRAGGCDKGSHQALQLQRAFKNRWFCFERLDGTRGACAAMMG